MYFLIFANCEPLTYGRSMTHYEKQGRKKGKSQEVRWKLGIKSKYQVGTLSLRTGYRAGYVHAAKQARRQVSVTEKKIRKARDR